MHDEDYESYSFNPKILVVCKEKRLYHENIEKEYPKNCMTRYPLYKAEGSLIEVASLSLEELKNECENVVKNSSAPDAKNWEIIKEAEFYHDLEYLKKQSLAEIRNEAKFIYELRCLALSSLDDVYRRIELKEDQFINPGTNSLIELAHLNVHWNFAAEVSKDFWRKQMKKFYSMDEDYDVFLEEYSVYSYPNYFCSHSFIFKK